LSSLNQLSYLGASLRFFAWPSVPYGASKATLFNVAMAMNDDNRLRRIAELGITDFETAEDVKRLQADMLARLKQSSVDADR
jgi:hypothetical protein